MARYGPAIQKKVVVKLLPPNTASIEEVSREVGVSVDTLERWRAQALTTPARERASSAAARFDAVLTTASMDEAARNAWCREHGVCPQELAAWRASATQALAEPQERAGPTTHAHWEPIEAVALNPERDVMVSMGSRPGTEKQASPA